MNSFTGEGGFVAGENNSVFNLCSSVSGGYKNTAGGFFFPSVSGGENNTSTGNCSSISGGNGISLSSGDSWAAGGSYHNP